MATLPFLDKMLVPIQWQTAVSKNTMTMGSYVVSGTIGFRPWRETATLVWRLSPADARALLQTLKQGMFNATYDYTCNVRGAIKIRPIDALSFDERFGGQFVQASLAVESLSV